VNRFLFVIIYFIYYYPPIKCDLSTHSILSVIGFEELTRRANELTVTEYRPLEIYTFLVVEYLLLILVASWIVRRLEKRLGQVHK
jgi:polar amino acid transport system permease protein